VSLPEYPAAAEKEEKGPGDFARACQVRSSHQVENQQQRPRNMKGNE